MSRTRLIRPEFFSDEGMAALSIEVRLVYIGLWTLTDDAGYFERKPRQIAAELFRYDEPAAREALIAVALDTLEERGRLRWLPCGAHGIIPTIPDHRIKGGEQLFTIRKRHAARCEAPATRQPTEDSVGSTEDSVSVSVSDSVSDSVSQGKDRPSKPGRSLRDISLEVGGFAGRLATRPSGAVGSRS